MKKRLMIIVFVMVAVMSITSCNTSNTNTEKGNNESGVTQKNGTEANKDGEGKDNNSGFKGEKNNDTNTQGDTTVSSDDNTFKTYTNNKYLISFEYPASWKATLGDEKSYKGNNGYFFVNATLATDIEALVKSETGHEMNPYGTKPVITDIKVQGQEARLVLPSEDQNRGYNKQAILFVKYPKDTKIDGQVYGTLCLIADKDHIKGIADTLKFTVK